MGAASKKAILLPASKLTKFCFRTPLMAAAACADISIFTAVLDACGSIFASSSTCEVEIVSVATRTFAAYSTVNCLPPPPYILQGGIVLFMLARRDGLELTG